jgi:uncharacterized protein with HEPN domain
MPRDSRLYLDDILGAVEKVSEYVRGIDYAAFAGDLKTQDAVIRNLEIIGEAARHLPVEMTERAPAIQWPKIMGLRDILTHEYFGINLAILWDVIQNKLDPLAEACHDLLESQTVRR